MFKKFKNNYMKKQMKSLKEICDIGDEVFFQKEEKSELQKNVEGDLNQW